MHKDIVQYREIDQLHSAKLVMTMTHHTHDSFNWLSKKNQISSSFNKQIIYRGLYSKGLSLLFEIILLDNRMR